MIAKTEWPMVWTVVPEKYVNETELGQLMTFRVEAIPDPDYINTLGGTVLGVAPALPPMPVLQQYIVHQQDFTEGGDDSFYELTMTDGFAIDGLDIRLFFPYESIKYKRDGETFTAETPGELFDDGFDFVFEFKPDQRASIEKFIELEAVSTSIEPLRNKFWFKLINNWGEAVDTLKMVTEKSKEHFKKVGEAADQGGPAEAPEGNTVSEQEFSPKKKEKEASARDFKQRTGMSYDELLREPDPSVISGIIAAQGGAAFITELVDSSTPATATTNKTNPLLVEGVSMDEILRENTVEDLMARHDMSFAEIIELLKQLSHP